MNITDDYLDKHHSEVSSKELSYKWEIGLERSKVNLDITTKMNVRSDIFPINNRYQINLLYHKLRRLRVKLYTDILFDNDTSVWGNEFPQIYADGNGFVYVLPMRYKAGAGDPLGNAVKSFGIMNEITVTTRWKKSVRMQSSWASLISITFIFLPLTHNSHGRSKPKTRSDSSRLEYIGVRQGVRFRNAFGFLD